MAATTAAVVAEEDTELRDLLVQTLENSGVLNRIKVRRGGCRGSRFTGRGTPARGGHAAVGPWPEPVGPVWSAQARAWPSLARCTRGRHPRVCTPVLSRRETDL